ncbi:MAG: hypothetical protein L6263_04535, partial [Desulfobacteraceae bacterium]|nr:hypothetical protein [Pseudomonadota bacterium]MCG2757678.1 hypothetical protein [Desulfobacteraceae bacterium]
QNTNIEIRNSKQIRIPNQKMTKTKQGPGAPSPYWESVVFVIGAFVFFVIVSHFVLRISILISP